MPPNDQLHTLVGYQLWRAASTIRAALATGLAELNLRGSEASVLIVLGNEPLLTQSEIGRYLTINRPNMASLIASLITRGLVERTAGSQKGQPLKLTPAGAELAVQARACMIENDQRFFGHLDSQARSELSKTLASLCQPPSS